MITLEELNPKNFPLSEVQTANLLKLHAAMNIVREAFGKPMFVTSGVRSMEDHKRIYMEIARARGIKQIRIPMGSQHLHAAAVDILDRSGALYEWCKANEAVLIQAGLYCEEDQGVPRVHFQIYPPRSGNRWFRP